MDQQQQPSRPPQQFQYEEYEQPPQTIQPTMPTMPPQQGYFQQPVPIQQPQPYYQPPMYTPVQPQVNVMVNQVVRLGVRRRHTNMVVRVLYFLFIGSWLGLLWLMTTLFLICTFVGAPLGIVMLSKTGKIFFLS